MQNYEQNILEQASAIGLVFEAVVKSRDVAYARLLEIEKKLDDALYEVQILEGAIKVRDKKIKALQNNLRYIQMSVQEGLGD